MKIRDLCYLAIIANLVFFCFLGTRNSPGNTNIPLSSSLDIPKAPSDFSKAVRYNDSKTVIEMLKADPNLVDKEIATGYDYNTFNTGHRALHLFARYGNVDMVSYLISAGADVNAITYDGDTPLHYAIGSKKNTLEIIKLLIDGGAYTSIRNDKGNTPLDFTKRKDYENKHIGVIAYLKTKGATY